MRLSNKHANPQTVEYKDFTGGLNTTNAIEMIQPNELNRCINFELAGSLLRSVSGTKTLFETSDVTMTDMFYDVINDLLIVCTSDSKVWSIDVNKLLDQSYATAGYEPDSETEATSATVDYVPSEEVPATSAKIAVSDADDASFVELGSLTGGFTPAFCSWEDGVLIASGGRLQYFNGSELTTITTSPEVCNGVFTSHGRVIVYYGDEIHYSAVGDETNWTTDTNDESSSQWLQVGYKDGGKIIAVVNLSSDIIALKDNNMAFRISGQFPNWSQTEISRNVDDKSYRSAIALTNSAIVLGRSMLQAIATTNDYGDMKATNLAAKVQDDIQALPNSVKLRYVAPLNQIWLVSGEQQFLFFDVANEAFFRREYNARCVDVCSHGDTVFVLKDHAICYLDSSSVEMVDNGRPLKWSLYAKTLVSYNDYLIKRVRVDITPLFQTYANVNFYVGHVKLSDLVPSEAMQVWHDYTYIFGNKCSLKAKPNASVFTNSDELYGNDYRLYNNATYIKSMVYIRQERRQLDRHKGIKVYAKGSGGRFILNLINFELVEV